MEHESDYDVVVIGGSFAGMAAALQLARARRRVLVVDAGLRRNRFADRSHGFLTQDGRPPGEITAQARAQLSGLPKSRLARWDRGDGPETGIRESLGADG